MEELPRCRRTTWSDAERWSDELERRIRERGTLPQTIVALTRGGWVPARLLADRLGVKRLVALRAQHWGVTATRSGSAEITEGLSGPVTGERVLLLDDITDTGESLELALKHVSAARPASLETATFLHITHSKYVPTYYAEEIPRAAWVWVVFPWNYWEDLRALVGRVGPEDRPSEAVQRTLREACGLDVPLADVERVRALPREGPSRN